MQSSSLPDKPSKEIDPKVKNLAKLLEDKGWLSRDNPKLFENRFKSLCKKDIIVGGIQKPMVNVISLGEFRKLLADLG